jgi:hypothetical protein
MDDFQAAVKRQVSSWINEIILQITSDNSDSNNDDSLIFRIDCLYNTLVRYDSVDLGIDRRIISILRLVRDCLGYHNVHNSANIAAKIFDGRCGRPRYLVPQEQLEYLIERRFSVPEISALLGVSSRTVERRLSSFGVSVRETFTHMSDDDLDLVVKDILSHLPNTGYKRMTGLLLSRGVRVQQSRIRVTMRRVIPEGSVLRSLELNVLHRRRYQVYGPLALWHIDGNHKLIRYVFFPIFIICLCLI